MGVVLAKIPIDRYVALPIIFMNVEYSPKK